MAQVGRPAGRRYSEMVSFVVAADVAEAIKAQAEREQRSVSDWLRVTVMRSLTVTQAAALVAEDEATDAREMVR
jgi:hypothetical protein